MYQFALLSVKIHFARCQYDYPVDKQFCESKPHSAQTELSEAGVQEQEEEKSKYCTIWWLRYKNSAEMENRGTLNVCP